MKDNVPDVPRLGQLDGLRGLASLWVLLGHTSLGVGAYFTLLHDPAYAVDLFMLLSGFLMAWQAIGRENKEPWHAPRTWVSFYIRRFFRIAPLYYLLLIPAYYFASHLIVASQSVNAIRVYPRHFLPADMPSLWAHVTFVFGLMPRYVTSLVLPDWSLSLEMQFYLCFPLLMLLMRRRSVMAPTLLVAVIALMSQRFLGLYGAHGTLANFEQPSFLGFKIHFFWAGMLLARAYQLPPAEVRRVSLIILANLLGVMDGKPLDSFLILLLSLLLFFQPSESRSLTRISGYLSGRLAGFMADMSYGVYLVHNFYLWLVTGYLVQKRWFVALKPSRRALVVIPLVIAGSYLTAWVLHHRVEKPGIALGKRLCESFVRGAYPWRIRVLHSGDKHPPYSPKP